VGHFGLSNDYRSSPFSIANFIKVIFADATVIRNWMKVELVRHTTGAGSAQAAQHVHLLLLCSVIKANPLHLPVDLTAQAP
jgi:hypothetical protein